MPVAAAVPPVVSSFYYQFCLPFLSCLRLSAAAVLWAAADTRSLC